jgi:hypothetical protein
VILVNHGVAASGPNRRAVSRNSGPVPGMEKRRSPRPEWKHAIWLYQPGHRSGGLPANVAGYRLAHSWADVVRAVQAEQGGRQHLKVCVYPCAPLQHIEQLNQQRT